jgi:hypothetical protein
MNIKLGILIFTLFFTATLAGCQNAQTAATNNNNTPVVATNASANTPTEAYKNLYAAVKSKNTEAIKQNMSKTTREFAEQMAQMQKKTAEDMYKNGLIESTLSPNLPPMRDERVKGNFGGVEVQNPDGNWQDVPFVKEDGGWKLAVGELFKNTYESPGKPASQANANTQMPQMIPTSNTSTRGNVNIIPTNSNSANVNSNAAVKPGMPGKVANK